LVKRILDGAAEAGAETKVYNLNELNINGCQACGYCKTHGHCQQKDDMTPIYEDLIKADGIVIGSPIYMDYLNAQTMLFVNRLYAFFNPGGTSAMPRGKKGALVFSSGAGEEAGYRKLIESFGQKLSGLCGIEIKGIVGSGGNAEAGVVKNNQNLMDKAFTLGQELAR
jgi:multimeric flavodoxin WrbA